MQLSDKPFDTKLVPELEDKIRDSSAEMSMVYLLNCVYVCVSNDHYSIIEFYWLDYKGFSVCVKATYSKT